MCRILSVYRLLSENKFMHGVGVLVYHWSDYSTGAINVGRNCAKLKIPFPSSVTSHGRYYSSKGS